MTRRGRTPALLLLALAVAGLVAIAGAPRGVVRVAAAVGLDRHQPATTTSFSAPGEDLQLPGVRPLVGREEDDHPEAPAATIGSPGPGVAAPALPGGPAGEPVEPPDLAPARSLLGDRAPPRSI